MVSPIADFKARLDKATASRKADGSPNVAVMAANGDGTLLHKVESGTYLPHEKNPNRKSDQSRAKFTADTVCWIASCTKLMTTIAVMQCVEKGILRLDDDVGETWLPEFKNVDVLLKVEDDSEGNPKPVLKKATKVVTLRSLLTHSSGLAYEFTHPKLNSWRMWSSSTAAGRALARSLKIEEAMRVPLLFEPGESWVYGYGIDWAGLAVMRATNQTLEEYMSANIWEPLGMRSTTFSPADHRPDLYDRLAGLTERDGDGNLHDTDGGIFGKTIDRVKHAGGGGCFSTANDYIRLLSSLLNTATDASNPLPQLVTKATVDEMFTPNISVASTHALHTSISHPLSPGLAGNLANKAVSWGLGGILNTEQVATTGRSPGAMQWSGLPNLFWWISPKDNTCGCYFGQILPPGDAVSLGLYEDFERAVLEEKKLRSSRL